MKSGKHFVFQREERRKKWSLNMRNKVLLCVMKSLYVVVYKIIAFSKLIWYSFKSFSTLYKFSNSDFTRNLGLEDRGAKEN